MYHYRHQRNQTSLYLQVEGDIPARMLHGHPHLRHQDGHLRRQCQQDRFHKSAQWSHCFSATINSRTTQRSRIYFKSFFSTKAQSKRTFTSHCNFTHTSWAWSSQQEFPADSISPTIMHTTPSRTSRDRTGEQSSFLRTTTRTKKQIGSCRIALHTLSPDLAFWT